MQGSLTLKRIRSCRTLLKISRNCKFCSLGERIFASCKIIATGFLRFSSESFSQAVIFLQIFFIFIFCYCRARPQNMVAGNLRNYFILKPNFDGLVFKFQTSPFGEEPLPCGINIAKGFFVSNHTFYERSALNSITN